MKIHGELIVCCIIAAILVSACVPARPKTIPLSEADKKFIETCKNDFKYDIVLRQLPNTLWIYIPLKMNFIELKASDQASAPVAEDQNGAENVSLKFVKSEYADRKFIVSYDISSTKLYTEDTGYESSYNEKFREIQSNIFNVLRNAYFDVGINPDTEKMPPFFTIVFADITNGIKFTNTMYFQDFKKAYSPIPSLTQEEFTQRYISDLKGDKKIINDVEGKNLEVVDIHMTDFLAKQIKNRIKFKYQSSRFKPTDDTIAELAELIARSFKAYNFIDYDQVILKDINKQSEIILDRPRIADVEQSISEGKFHVIEFKY